MFALDLMRGNLCSAPIAWNLSLGSFRLGSIVSKGSLRILCLESFASEPSLEKARSGLLA